MTGSNSRRIALAQQIEEMALLASEQQTSLASPQRRKAIGAGVADERLARQAAILETLKWNLAHEHEIRAWAAERRGQAK